MVNILNQSEEYILTEINIPNVKSYKIHIGNVLSELTEFISLSKYRAVIVLTDQNVESAGHLKKVLKILEPTGKKLYTGILKAGDLAGYRNHQVYISGARHVPPPAEAVLDSMKTLEKLLLEEKSAAVRAILGHFIFVFIHPYMDGNGRIGRFILNLMLVSGGYNWTVIRVSERNRYMAALESASVDGNIVPFTEFVLSSGLYNA